MPGFVMLLLPAMRKSDVTCPGAAGYRRIELMTRPAPGASSVAFDVAGTWLEVSTAPTKSSSPHRQPEKVRKTGEAVFK